MTSRESAFEDEESLPDQVLVHLWAGLGML